MVCLKTPAIPFETSFTPSCLLESLISANMPKKSINFSGLKAVDLVDSVKKVEQRSISDETKKQYASKLKVYQSFLDEVGEGTPCFLSMRSLLNNASHFWSSRSKSKMSSISRSCLLL